MWGARALAAAARSDGAQAARAYTVESIVTLCIRVSSRACVFAAIVSQRQTARAQALHAIVHMPHVGVVAAAVRSYSSQRSTARAYTVRCFRGSPRTDLYGRLVQAVNCVAHMASQTLFKHLSG